MSDLPKRLFAAHAGISLAETLVGIGLLGAILIPLLFMSSAYFTNQLLQTRTSMEVSHNASQFASRFINDLYNAQRILPTVTSGGVPISSDSTHLFFAYYDPIAQTEVKTGYQLTTVGSDVYLERLIYNGGTWSTLSPYSSTASDQLKLPAGTVFTYCADNASPCTAASSPDKALLVRLTGWTFSKGSKSLPLPDLDAYVSVSPNAPIVISDQAREIFSFTQADSFGAGTDLALLFIPASGNKLAGISATGGSSGGVLSTIVSGAEYPGYEKVAATVDGRVFFGEGTGTNLGSFWTWKESTGLSTILDNETHPGRLSTAVAPDGRVYFGEHATGPFWTWIDNGTGAGKLSTIVASESSPGRASVQVASDGRVYFGEWASSGTFWTWKPGEVSPTVIVSGKMKPGVLSAKLTSDGKIYFGEYDNNDAAAGSFWYYDHGGSGLTEIIAQAAGHINPGHENMAVASDGRVYFGTHNTGGNSKMFTWKNGVGLTTLPVSGDEMGDESTQVSPVDPDRVFFGENDSTPGDEGFWTWKNDGSANGVLTPIVPGAAGYDNPGHQCSNVGPNGRVYFCVTASGVPLWSWEAGVGSLSTLLTSVNNPGRDSAVFDSTGVMYFGGGASSQSFWRWEDDGSGAGILSTILDGGSSTARDIIGISPVDGRVFFGTNDAAGAFYTWHEDTGLSTLVENVEYPGKFSLAVSDNGRIFFGERSATGSFWTWAASAPTLKLSSVSKTGSPTAQTVNLSYSGSPSYVAAESDDDGYVYFVENGTDTIDRYKYSSAGYSSDGQIDWSDWGTAMAAVAVDAGSNKIALLDDVQNKVHIFDDRYGSGKPPVGEHNEFAVAGSTTGMDISDRTGNFLIIESTGAATINLHIYNGQTYAFIKTIPIDVTTPNLSATATTETNFKIKLDASQNILYLIAPTLNRVYALSMPEYL